MPEEMMQPTPEQIKKRMAFELKTLTDRLAPYKPSQKEEIIATFCDELKKIILSLQKTVDSNQNDIESIKIALGY